MTHTNWVECKTDQGQSRGYATPESFVECRNRYLEKEGSQLSEFGSPISPSCDHYRVYVTEVPNFNLTVKVRKCRSCGEELGVVGR